MFPFSTLLRSNLRARCCKASKYKGEAASTNVVIITPIRIGKVKTQLTNDVFTANIHNFKNRVIIKSVYRILY